MEFGYNASEDQVAKILTYAKGSDERKEIIAGDNSESFSADRAGERLGFTFVLYYSMFYEMRNLHSDFADSAGISTYVYRICLYGAISAFVISLFRL